jgi:hypothetical protein
MGGGPGNEDLEDPDVEGCWTASTGARSTRRERLKGCHEDEPERKRIAGSQPADVYEIAG